MVGSLQIGNPQNPGPTGLEKHTWSIFESTPWPGALPHRAVTDGLKTAARYLTPLQATGLTECRAKSPATLPEATQSAPEPGWRGRAAQLSSAQLLAGLTECQVFERSLLRAPDQDSSALWSALCGVEGPGIPKMIQPAGQGRVHRQGALGRRGMSTDQSCRTSFFFKGDRE